MASGRQRKSLSMATVRSTTMWVASVDEGGGKIRHGGLAAGDDLIEADPFGVLDAFLDRAERRTVEEVGHGDMVAGGAQPVGEGTHAFGEPLGVVEQDKLRHRAFLSSRARAADYCSDTRPLRRRTALATRTSDLSRSVHCRGWRWERL